MDTMTFSSLQSTQELVKEALSNTNGFQIPLHVLARGRHEHDLVLVEIGRYTVHTAIAATAHC